MATVQPCSCQCGFECAGPGWALAEVNANEGSEDAQEMETKKVGALLTYSEYLSVDEDVVTAEHISAESDMDIEDAVIGHATPTFADAIVALDTLRRYASVHGCMDSEKGWQHLERELCQAVTRSAGHRLQAFFKPI